MIYSNKIKDAIKFSIKTHDVYQKQKRKGKDIAYATHPLTVGIILSLAGASEDVIVAGILHDTIEDSVPEKKVTKDMLAERFGQNVAELVDSVTEQKVDPSSISARFQYLIPWEVRKAKALEHIAHLSHDSFLVKSADILSNATELIDDYARDGDAVFARFGAPKEKILEDAYRVILELVSRWPDSPLESDLLTLGNKMLKVIASSK